MEHFILLTRLVREDEDPHLSFEDKARAVKAKIAARCPEVEWTASFATLGPWHYVDHFTAPGVQEAMKVASLVRLHGHARTEIWPAIAWDIYKENMRGLDRP